MASFQDHFSVDSAAYAAYRPVYPADFIADIASLAPAPRLAWDCATGNGQAARLLAPHFERVLATDASAEQIGHAGKHAGIDFRVAREDDSGAASSSVQLVTVATALHWLDLDRFYGEVRRVLVTKGVVAAWCYGFAQVSTGIDDITTWFAEDRVGPYWPAQRVHVDSGYRELPFPFDELSIGVRSMTARLEREAYIGYLGTWSSVHAAVREEGRSPIPELRERLLEHWADGETRPVTWPLHYRIGRSR